MAGSSRFPTHHVPDEGVEYAPGDIVRIDRSSSPGHSDIVKDLDGDYEVANCRRATEFAGDPPLLRIGLRKRGATPPLDDPPPSPTPQRARW